MVASRIHPTSPRILCCRGGSEDGDTGFTGMFLLWFVSEISPTAAFGSLAMTSVAPSRKTLRSVWGGIIRGDIPLEGILRPFSPYSH